MIAIRALHSNNTQYPCSLFRCGLIFLSESLEHLISFGGLTVLSALASLLDLVTPSLSLVIQHLRTRVLSLAFVDEFHQYALILEHVSFAFHVKVMVKMTVNLLRLSVLLQETAKNPHSAHPEHFDRHTRIGSTLTLSCTSVATFATSNCVLTNTGTRMHSHGFAND